MENEKFENNNDTVRKDEAKWYIVTSINGNEDTVYKNIEDKVRAYDLGDVVQEMRLLKTREITIEVFDPINNPPPSRFRNTKSITWETLPGGRYKKTRIREINRFPGYIYIKMIMEDQAWYVIRNTFGVTGFVGSSGKGAKPIPMSDIEVENLFNPEMNQDIIINKTSDVFVEQTVSKPREPEKRIEFLDSGNNLVDKDGFFNSNLSQENKGEETSSESVGNVESSNVDNISSAMDESTNSETDTNSENQYLSNHDGGVEEVTINDDVNNNQEEETEEEVELFHKGNSDSKSPLFAVGNTVEILVESMQGYEGVIESIDLEKDKAKVLVDILGKETIVDVHFSEIRKKI